MLKFSPANAKTKRLRDIPELQRFFSNKRKVYSLDLLSGWSCPGAQDCLARVFVENGKRWLQDGSKTQFRCFSASQEVAYPNVYDARKHNFDVIKSLKTAEQIASEIINSLPRNVGIVRYHVGGDFFKRNYLNGAILASEMRPDVLFYAYTKALNFLADTNMVNPSNGEVRHNFLVTTSVGGKHDSLIPQLGIRTAKVVFSESEAGQLPIDHDDSHAATVGGDFALLLHGVQPAGSIASKALRVLRGKGSYNRKVGV